VLAPDGLTIYFASDRGLSDVDIFAATRPTTAAPFGTPVRLRNVNSTVTDAPSWVSRDQCRLYMSSARAGTPDVYVASRPTF
jgi:Tol biopolymer transport system component